jgi:hypothetical protein
MLNKKIKTENCFDEILQTQNKWFLEFVKAGRPYPKLKYLSSGMLLRGQIALMMEAVSTSKRSVNFYETTRRC